MAVARIPGPARTLLVRHGETDWNAERRYTTRTDVELNADGLAQARRAAAAVADVHIERAFCSPLRRARRTAEVILAEQGRAVELVTDERLREIDAGPFEGRTPEEIEASPLAEAYRAWHTDEDAVFPSGAESFDDALARIVPFAHELPRLPGITLVATHGSIVRLLVASFVIGAPPARHRRMWLDNGSFAIIDWQSGMPRLIGFNRRDVDCHGA